MKTLLAVFLLLSLSPAKDLSILIKMLPAQEKFFREEVLKPFEEKNGVAVNVHTFVDNADLIKQLEESKTAFDVVKVPMGMATPLASKNLVQPLGAVVGDARVAEMSKSYFLMKLCKVDGKVFYLPRKFETRIMVYRKSKVENAAARWKNFREDVNGFLKKQYGKQLPMGYRLEANPSSWDYYDIFVVGYIWAHIDHDRKKSGRVAHRGKEYSGTVQGIIDRCFQLGAQKNEIVNLKSNKLREVMKWESLFVAGGIYPKEMWEQGWSGTDLWGAFGRGDIFLSFLTQIDCYFLHGTKTPGMKGFPAIADDLGFALMPKGMLVGLPFNGKRSVSTGGWLWGVGAKSGQGKLAVSLIETITNYDNQVGGTHRFGMIPVRKDILGKANILFQEPWKTQVFKISVQQLKTNGGTSLPFVAGFDKIERQYLKLWKKVIEESKGGALSDARLKKLASEVAAN